MIQDKFLEQEEESIDEEQESIIKSDEKLMRPLSQMQNDIINLQNSDDERPIIQKSYSRLSGPMRTIDD